MENAPESRENKNLSEEEVISIFDKCDFEAPEVIEIARWYADQCHREADQEAMANPESAEASNRANIKAEIKIALVYFKSEKYQEKGYESLEDAFLSASQNESTADLADQISSILKST